MQRTKIAHPVLSLSAHFKNENKDTFARNLKAFAVATWFVLFFGGLMGHQGSYWVYIVFTFVLTAVLFSGVYRRISYGYMFLTIFFWLGFWLKLSVHNILQYDYVEPIGRFDGSTAAWDKVLYVATVAGMGILLGRWLYGALRGTASLQVEADSARVPLWYLGHRPTLWVLLMGSIVGVAALNSIYGIQQSGLTPRTILIWPLNGLIYWLLSTGMSMALATILWWDICLKKDISLPIYAVFGEAFLSTVSLLSRGLFVFHIIPPLVAIGLNSKQLVWKARQKFFLALCILGLIFILSLAVVSTLRSYLFQFGQDFRTTTQNKITRLQILQTIIPTAEQRNAIKGLARLEILQTVVPTLQERIAIKSIARLEVLGGLIPVVEDMVNLKGMNPAEIQRRIKIHDLKIDVPIEEQLQELIKEKIWLERNIPQIKERALAAKRVHEKLRPVSENEMLMEDQFQGLTWEKAWLEQSLTKFTEQAGDAKATRSADSVNLEDVAIDDQFLSLVIEKADLEQTLAERKVQAAVALGSWFGKSGLLLDEFSYQITTGFINRIFALGVDRWIGMEGVMAISSYREKSFSLFTNAMTERSGLGEIPLYQKVSQSIYQETDMSKYQFASLPGASAFFFYTGSLWVVFAGMLMLTLVAIFSEHLVYLLTGNVLLCALIGMNAANAIAQLGVVPRQLLIHLGMTFGAVFVIWAVQSRQLAGVHRWFFRSKTPT